MNWWWVGNILKASLGGVHKPIQMEYIVYCRLEACLLGVKDCMKIFISICLIFIDQFCQQ